MTLTYVITGASRGLGLEFVRQISSQGHTVYALARNPEASKGLQSLIDGKNVFAVKLDANSEKSIKEAVDEININVPGGIDILINNAGIGCDASVNVENATKQEYMRIFETNVCGVSDITQAFLPLLRKRDTKKILNISSVLGSISATETANPASVKPPYCVSKAALNMLTKMFANHLADEKFIVYASHPGWVKTDMGGDSAPVEQTDSIAGMLKVLDSVTSKDNGEYYNYTGEKFTW
ncbi:hypothetical protein MFLAVUS_010505 [Mucor flavus]|uniref:C-factor n=1 Tax=Mucor flavus TaxID=439312 RepID=A0ABP9ZCX5_9FUNG